MKHVIQYNRFIGENDFLSLDNDKFKFIIASGTNSGKTTYIIEKLLKENRPFIFLVDTIALGKNLSKKFNLPFHYSGNKVNIETKQVITLYNHLGFFYSEHNLDRIIVIDEVHSLITALSYRKEHIQNLVEELSYYDKIIGLTGTFISSKFFDNFIVFQCDREKEKLPVTLVRFSNVIGKVVELTKAAIERRSKVFIYIQNKSLTGDFGKLIATLKENGIDSISVLNSETIKDENNIDGAVEIVEQETFNTQVLISTYSQGFSLQNDNVEFICFPGVNYVDMVQSIARLRRNPVNIYVLNNATNGNGDFVTETERLFNLILSECHNEQRIALATMKSERHFSRILESKPVCKYFENSYSIDTNLVAHDVIAAISTEMEWNIGLLQSMLNYYGLTISFIDDINPKITPCEIKTTKEGKQIEIQHQCNVMFTLLDNNLSIPQNMFPLFQQYKQLCEIMSSKDAKTFMIEKYPTMTKQGMVEVLLRGYFNSPAKVEHKFLKVLVLNHFKSGEVYSVTEIKQIMQKFAKECNIPIKPSKEVMTLGCILEIKAKTKKEKGKVIHVIKIL